MRGEDRLRESFEQAAIGIALVSLDGAWLEVNRTLCALLGYSEEELRARSCDEIADPADRDMESALARELLAGQRTAYQIEVTLLAKDGRGVRVRRSVAVVRDAGGEPAHFAWLVEDVTAARAAETELRESRAQLVATLDHAPAGVSLRDLDGRFVRVNAFAADAARSSPQDMIGRHPRDYVDDVTKAVVDLDDESLLSSRMPITRETPVHQPDGSTKWYYAVKYPVLDERGEVSGLGTFSLDITDRKRAEVRFHGLLEAAPDAIVGVDRDGRIVLVNAQAERLFGYLRQELLGRHVEMLVPEAARGAHLSHRERYVKDPSPRPMGAGMALAARRKNGTEFPAEIQLSAIETVDGMIVAAGIRDVSERLEARAERERLLAEAERARLERRVDQARRLESLGLLAGGVAHDFNNLLAVIINCAAFIGDEVADDASTGHASMEAIRTDVAEIRSAAERAAWLTRQLLAFGRREVIRCEILNLNDVVADVAGLLMRTLGSHVELATDLAPELWSVEADPGQLEQVLVNLAVNARDAMPRGGTLLLQTTNLVADEAYVARRPALRPGAHVRLRVSDTGAGMERTVVERAFEPFFTTKPEGEGSGLGLATVYGIVKQSGGDVDIDSEPGRGTTISVTLPATTEQPAAPDHPVPVRPHSRGTTVLLVEDEDGVREVARRILTRNGYEVIVADRADAAIRAARDHDGEIDLLLTDVVMPQMPGTELAQQITAIRPGLCVLYMSGYAQPLLVDQGALDNSVHLLQKPFTQPQLLETIDAVLGEHRATANPGCGQG